MKSFFLLIVLFLWSASLAAEEWKSFSYPFPINDAIGYGDGVLLATDAGIRFRTLGGDYVFHPSSGLETSRYYALATSGLGVFAISEYGMIAAMNADAVHWRILSRSYVSNNVKVVPGAAAIGNTILVIAFTNRLAFFDLVKGTSVLTIDRIGNESLLSNTVQKLSVHGDSLYVRFKDVTYVRQMPWDNLATDYRLNDPVSWTKVLDIKGLPEFELLDTTKVVVDGEVLDHPFLFDVNVSRIRWQIPMGDAYYLVGPHAIVYYDRPGGKKGFTDITDYHQFSLERICELHTLPTGGVMVSTADIRLSYTDSKGWRPYTYAYGVSLNSNTPYETRYKLLSHLPDGHVFYHVWGLDYQVYSNWGEDLDFSISSSDGTCLDLFSGNTSITITSVAAPDNTGFLVAPSNNNGYSLAYISKTGEVHCASNVGDNPHVGSMYATVDDDGSWVVYVGNRFCPGFACSGNLDVLKFTPPRLNGGELANPTQKKSYKGLTTGVVDMAYDSNAKRLWMVSSSGLYYFDEERDSVVSPLSTNGLMGAEYSSIDIDLHSNLWLGSVNQGVYRLAQKKNSPDTLTVSHYTSRNGLLDNNVADVAVDPILGVVWFAHEKGVTYYRRNDLKESSRNMTDSALFDVHAYPVPYRPKVHARFTIEGIAEDATVSLYNRGGALIQSFRKEDVLGGKLEWYGFDKNGKLVAPGVYYYVVNNGSKVKKGKFIIVH